MINRKIAVLLATYNGEKYLPELLESLLNQSCKEIVLFVRDDGSTDRTLSIVADYSSRLDTVYINSTQRLGPAKSFIQLLLQSGEGFSCYMFADQDDYWHHDKIERAYAKLAELKNEEPVLYCAGLELVDSSLSHIGVLARPRVLSYNNALVENVAIGCTIAINEKARSLILSNLPKALIMHDWWLYIVISALGKVIYDDFTSIKYRQHPSNAVGAATGLINDLVRKTKRFFSNQVGGVFSISDQAEEFYQCYSHLLTSHYAELAQSLFIEKKTIIGRLHLALASNFIRQKYFDTIILRILFIFGRF
jgi:glycosyltransferase involved in cell wall biosynthesis